MSVRLKVLQETVLLNCFSFFFVLRQNKTYNNAESVYDLYIINFKNSWKRKRTIKAIRGLHFNWKTVTSYYN